MHVEQWAGHEVGEYGGTEVALAEDRSLVQAAESCDDCLSWLEHCQAECCRGFAFSLTPDCDVVSSDAMIRVHAPLRPDTVRYYELHGALVDVEAEVVVVPRAKCTVSSGRLMVMMPCSALDGDCLCRLHDGGQPDVCSGFTWETARSGRWVVTPKCLFAYRMKDSMRELG